MQIRCLFKEKKVKFFLIRAAYFINNRDFSWYVGDRHLKSGQCQLILIPTGEELL